MIKKLRQDWDEYFFSRRPATSLGLFRVFYGIMVLSWCVLIFPDLGTWYTERGFFTLQAMRVWGLDPYGFSILTMHDWMQNVFGISPFQNVTTYAGVLVFFCLLVLFASMLAVGYKSRLAAIMTALLLVSFHHRDGIILNGGDTLMRNMGLLLIFADSGAAVSVDRLIKIKRGLCDASTTALADAWPQRLMQLQLAAVYLSTVLSKVGGSEWLDGTAFYYSSELIDLQRFSLHGLNTHPWFFIFGTYFTLFSEFAMGTFVFSRRLRPYALCLGIVIHTGVEYSMVVPLFSFTIVSCYLNFVYQDWIESFAAGLHKRFERFTVALPALGVPGRVRQILAAMDGFCLIRWLGSEDNPPSTLTPALLTRALWRSPMIWSLAFAPLIDIILIRALPSFLFATGIAWPVLVFIAVNFAAKRLSKSRISVDPASDESSRNLSQSPEFSENSQLDPQTERKTITA